MSTEGVEAKRFWDARAAEDALYFVDDRLDYGKPDEERFWTRGEKDLDVLLDMVGARIEPTDSVVDIGCGVGRFTRVLAKRAADVRAIDVSPRMLELARSYNGGLANVTWIEGDGVSLAGIDDASADVCFSHVVFQHIPDPQITLGYVREIGRALRPGGWALFQVSNDPSVHVVRTGWRRGLGAALGRAPRGQRHPNWRGSHVDLDDLGQAASDGGMELERVEGAGTQFCMVRTRKRG